MTNEHSDDDALIQQADDIAAKITKMLVDAFEKREGRRPTPEEVEQLIEEITEERIEELLSGGNSQSAPESQEAGSDGKAASSDDEDEDEDEDGEEEEREAADEGNSAADSPLVPEVVSTDSSLKGEVSQSPSAPTELVTEIENRSEKRRRISSS